MNGDQLNIRFSPSVVAGEEGDTKLRYLIETYFDMGGMQVQFNVVGAATLYAAQLDPAAFKNLIVRIAGFSAYFVEMPRVMQDDFISRTEQSEC
jgi:formate C-acetyltransferase